jgi:hypothetical protein
VAIRSTSFIALVAAAALAGCATGQTVSAEERRAAAEPRPRIGSVTVDGLSVRTLADAETARRIAAGAKARAALGFEGDNKGNACYDDPVFRGVAGGELSDDGMRRQEFWNYSVCGEGYEVPVIVTKENNGTVAFRLGSGREAR